MRCMFSERFVFGEQPSWMDVGGGRSMGYQPDHPGMRIAYDSIHVFMIQLAAACWKQPDCPWTVIIQSLARISPGLVLRVSIFWETPFWDISALLVSKFESSVSKLVGKLRRSILPTLKNNFSSFVFFDFWEPSFWDMSVPLAAPIDLRMSKLVGKLRS